MTSRRPLILVGTGGHAKVVLAMLDRLGLTVEGAVTADTALHGGQFLRLPVLGGDEVIWARPPGSVLLVNGIGSVRPMGPRRAVFEAFAERGYSFAQVIDPAAVVAGDSFLGEGIQIIAGAVVQPGCVIGANSIINTRAVLDHDCQLGRHVHLAPGATLSGGVKVGEDAHLGTGSTVIEGIAIGERALVAAGAVVVGPVAADSRVMGVPARAR